MRFGERNRFNKKNVNRVRFGGHMVYERLTYDFNSPYKNVALNKLAFSSTNYSNTRAQNAIDGTTTNYWFSAAGDLAPKLEINLLTMCKIDKIVFTSSAPPNQVKNYLIEGFDGVNWNVLVDKTGNTVATNTHTFAPINAEKIRMTFKGDIGHMRVLELEVHGNEDILGYRTNLLDENKRQVTFENNTNTNQYFILIGDDWGEKQYRFSADVEILSGSASQVDLSLLFDDKTAINRIKMLITNNKISGTFTGNIIPGRGDLIIYNGVAGETNGKSLKFTNMKLEIL